MFQLQKIQVMFQTDWQGVQTKIMRIRLIQVKEWVGQRL